MGDIAVASPSSYSSSSAGDKSLGGNFATSADIQNLLNGALEGQVHNNGQTASDHANEHEKAPRRKKGEKSTTIQTACVYCRGSKMKCIRNDERESCKRCVAAGIDCETKARRSDRRPGSGSKLAKAAAFAKEKNVAMLRAPPADDNNTKDGVNGVDLQADLHPSHITIPAMPPEMAKNHPSPSYTNNSFHAFGDMNYPPSTTFANPPLPYFADTSFPNQYLASPSRSNGSNGSYIAGSSSMPFSNLQDTQSTSHPLRSHLPTALSPPVASSSSTQAINNLLAASDGAVALHLNDSGKNQPQSFTRSPLALLAAAGAADRPQSRGTAIHPSSIKPGPRSLVGNLVNHSNYFSDYSPALLDYDHENDPIWRCIVTEEEARSLLDLYWMHLQPLVALLDPRLHSFNHVRSRSTLLFTSMMASAAKFAAHSAAAAQRLDEHAKKLAARVFLDGNVSLDTVQAFCILCPWLDTGPHVTLDITSTYLTMAYDRFKRLPSDLPTNTTHERLLARSYERTYLTLFNYDRGSALVQGDYLGITIKERKDLVGSVWQWASHPEAIQDDWLLAALVALRRDVPGVLSAVTKQGAEHKSASTAQPSPQIVRVVISEFLSSWQSLWMSKVSNASYLSIVGHHTTLSILITTLKEHVGQPSETAVLQQALLAALQTLQAFVAPDQNVLTYLVNNTFVMVAYAAAFVLKLLVQWSDVGSSIETSIYILLSQVERRLYDLGSHPSHRLGRSRIYGSQLGHVLRQQLQTRLPTRQHTPELAENAVKVSEGTDLTLTMPSFVDNNNGHGQNSHNIDQAMFAGAPSSGLSPFLNGDLPGANLDVAHMSVEEMTELLKSDYWLPLESNDFFDTSNFFNNLMDGGSSTFF